jgi:phosphoribosylanthranilate isomerase
MTTPAPIAHNTDAADRLASADSGPRVKVCGITDPSEIGLLARQQVDFVGLWHGVLGGPADLPLKTWRSLVAAAASSGDLAPVLVTFFKDVEDIRRTLEGSEAQWVQLHGYPTPGFVGAVKSIGPDVRVIKVLHIRGGKCVEERLLGAYESAGVDIFLFDAVADDGRVGSTGQTLDAELVGSLAERLTRPFLLAGGISAENRDRFAALAAHPLFLGIDVDTNARGRDGKVSEENVEAICRVWKGPHA